MNKLPIASSIVTLLAALAPMHAQSGANAPGDFIVERIITLNNAFAPVPPNLPPEVVAGIKAGAIELHQRFTYKSAQRSMEQLSFIVPGNSPVPYPNPSAAPVGDHYLVQIDSATLASSPRPSVILAGHVTSNDIPTPFGSNNGAGVTLTFGYTTAGPAVQFGPVIESVSPLYGLYSDTGAGSLSLTPSVQKCTASTLNGAYLFQLSGSQIGPSGWVPYTETGRFQADGKGTVTVVDSGNSGGNVFTNRTFPIAYALNDDCTGSFAFGPNAMDVQVSLDGKSINMVFTKPASIVASGAGRSQ